MAGVNSRLTAEFALLERTPHMVEGAAGHSQRGIKDSVTLIHKVSNPHVPKGGGSDRVSFFSFTHITLWVSFRPS